jgi:hypothetical protein
MVRQDDPNRWDGPTPLNQRSMEERDNENAKGLINSILCYAMSIYGVCVWCWCDAPRIIIDSVCIL